MLMFFVLSFFPRGVLDEILNLIESVSEGFPSYSNFSASNEYSLLEENKTVQLNINRLLYTVAE